MKIELSTSTSTIATIEIWEDKAPSLAKRIRAELPMSTYLQHGKLTGDLLLMQTKILADWENMFFPEDLMADAAQGASDVAGAVSYYGPRQQISIMYGSDVPPEPLPVSAIGWVVEGLDAVKQLGMQTWLRPGTQVRLSLLEE